jgi:hypothetical protein
LISDKVTVVAFSIWQSMVPISEATISLFVQIALRRQSGL